MSYTIETKGNSAVITLTIPQAEVEEGMKEAAKHMSEDSSIPGFRPGKATYEAVKQRVGEMKLMEAASEQLIRGEFVKAMLKENLETVGQPYFDVVKMAPGNDMIITAEIALYPNITKLVDYENLSVESKDTTPTKENIERSKKDLALMQTKEIRKEKGKELEQGDKAIVNLTMKKGGVVLEGGEGQGHGIYTAEEHYIPGLVGKILGMKEDETREFSLKFPEDNYQKHLAGQDVDFTIEMKEIFKLEAPEFNDEFAKLLGLENKEKLEETLVANLKKENEREESLRQDKAMLDLLAEKSNFDDISELLVNQEINQMVHELEHTVTQRGMKFDDYLTSIGKTIADLKLDFTAPALNRVKVGIVLKKVAEKEEIKVEDAEVDAELDKIAEAYKDNEDAKKKIFEPQYRDYVAHQMKNRKTIEFLKSKIIKS